MAGTGRQKKESMLAVVATCNRPSKSALNRFIFQFVCTHSTLHTALGLRVPMAGSDDVLVQFRAGLMNVVNNTLKADQRKGLIRLSQVICCLHAAAHIKLTLLWVEPLTTLCRQMMAFFAFGGLNALVQPKSKVTRRLTTSFSLVKRNSARFECLPMQSDVEGSESNFKTLLQVASAGAGSRIYTLAFAADKDRSLFLW